MTTPDHHPTDDTDTGELFAGDSSTLPFDIRKALVVLLKRRYVSADTHPKEWATIVENETLIRSRLNDLFCQLVVNRNYHVAYKQPGDPSNDDLPKLLRETVYTREQTILMVHLRQLYRQKVNDGNEHVFVDGDDLSAEIESYFPPEATDKAAHTRQARLAVEALARHGILLPTPEPNRFRVASIVEVLLPVPVLRDLLSWLQDSTGTDDSSDGYVGDIEMDVDDDE